MDFEMAGSLLLSFFFLNFNLYYLLLLNGKQWLRFAEPTFRAMKFCKGYIIYEYKFIRVEQIVLWKIKVKLYIQLRI